MSISCPPIASISSRTICTTFSCTRQPGGQPRSTGPAPSWRTRPGADHELVRERLGVGGRLALGRQEELRQARHEAPNTSRRARAATL